jgi:hypothetical protein
MVMDLVMFAHSTGGKERAHQEWKKLLEERGFPGDEVLYFPLGLKVGPEFVVKSLIF